MIKKQIFFIIAILCLFSCKKTQENKSKTTVSNEVFIDKIWNGDVLISDLSFVNSIDSSCKLSTTFFNRSEKQIKEDDSKCALSKIKFDYGKLNSINKKIHIGNLSSEIELFIKNSSPINANNADLSYQTTLYIEKNKTLSDSIIVYQSFNYSEALTVKTKYYYLDKDNIYLLDIAEDESGANVEKWEQYKINTSGKTSLVKQKLFTKENNTNTVIQNNTDIWKGNYYFEATNKDNIKTIFNITINSLENVMVNVIEDRTKNNYSNLKAEQIDNEKIKINYDESAGDMGTIYIEKTDNNYFISGNPIYFINPGNNEMPLQKTK